MLNKKSISRMLAIFGLAMSVVVSVEAGIVRYSYQGDPFTIRNPSSLSEGISAMEVSFTMDIALPPNLFDDLGDGFILPVPIIPSSWRMSDGLNTITNLTPGYTNAVFEVGTNSLGNIVEWVISTRNSDSPVIGHLSFSTNFSTFVDLAGLGSDSTSYCTLIEVGGQFCGEGFGGLTTHASPQNWIITSAVPIPASVWLFGSGFFGMMFAAKRKY